MKYIHFCFIFTMNISTTQIRRPILQFFNFNFTF